MIRANTRSPPSLIELGASPRATIFLTLAAKSHAFVQGRGYVTPQDVKSIAMDSHACVPYEAEAEEKSSEQIVQVLLDHLPYPNREPARTPTQVRQIEIRTRRLVSDLMIDQYRYLQGRA